MALLKVLGSYLKDEHMGIGPKKDKLLLKVAKCFIQNLEIQMYTIYYGKDA